MTCIVGLEHNGAVWMGGDAAATQGDCLQFMLLSDPKVFIRGACIFGCSGSVRMAQLLQHALIIPEVDPQKTAEAWIATDFINAVRSAFSSAGWTRVKEGAEEAGFFLLGFLGKLYRIEDDFGIHRPMRGYEALGSGGPYALGSLRETAGQCVDVRIAKALETAAALNAGVQPPFTILKLE